MSRFECCRRRLSGRRNWAKAHLVSWRSEVGKSQFCWRIYCTLFVSWNLPTLHLRSVVWKPHPIFELCRRVAFVTFGLLGDKFRCVFLDTKVRMHDLKNLSDTEPAVTAAYWVPGRLWLIRTLLQEREHKSRFQHSQTVFLIFLNMLVVRIVASQVLCVSEYHSTCCQNFPPRSKSSLHLWHRPALDSLVSVEVDSRFCHWHVFHSFPQESLQSQ